MKESRRRVIGLLLAGWLLGLVTAFLWPAVTTERQTVVVTSQSSDSLNSPRGIARLTEDGWIVVRTDTIRSTPVVQLERPRYLRVWDLVETWGTPPARPTPAPTKPTEAPKPPAASPKAL